MTVAVHPHEIASQHVGHLQVQASRREQHQLRKGEGGLHAQIPANKLHMSSFKATQCVGSTVYGLAK
jgi:hypothetical protein